MVDFFLFKTTLRDLMRAKRLVICVLLVAVPTLLALLFRLKMPAEEFNPETIYNTLAAGIIFGFLLTILSVVFGTGVLAQEIEQKTIVYILTRPVPRWR
ncbi:MAG: ABC transporter permease subunit, partial [Chthonomonadales bacterium]